MSQIPEWTGDVSRETMDRLNQYAALVLKWNSAINLIGKSTSQELWHRHIWDSYQLLPHIPLHALSLVDLGSGAGLPGLVIACARPLAVTLVERDGRKASFLREAARTLRLGNVSVVHDDAARLQKRYDLVTSRALAPLVDLCKLAAPLLGKNAFCLFPKGENYATELTQAKLMWRMNATIIPSQTNKESCIVSISELQRAE